MSRTSWRSACAVLAAAAVGGLLAASPGHLAPSTAPSAVAFSAAARTLGETELARLQAAEPRSTVLTSPLSIEAALAMLGQGARGDTAANLRDGLGLAAQGLGLPDAARGYAALRSQLTASRSVTLALANGVWADRRVHLSPSFARAEAGPFAAQITSADFANPATVGAINGFVSRATRGKIPSIVERLTPQDRLVLVDALYFKGDWQTPFDPAATKSAAFDAADGRTLQVPTMRRQGEFAYAETAAFQSVALPYSDPRFELVLLLMKDPDAAPPAGWTAALAASRFEIQEGSVSLPRLDITWGGELTATLRSAGLGVALGAHPDFSGVGGADSPLAVGQVIHKTRLVVDEKGTVGAAATAVMMQATACYHCEAPRPFVFKADRPFWLMLRERTTGAPIFLGYVAAPQG